MRTPSPHRHRSGCVHVHVLYRARADVERDSVRERLPRAISSAGAIRSSQITPGVILKECLSTYDPTPATKSAALPHTSIFRSTCDSLRTWQSTLTRHPARNLGVNTHLSSPKRDHPRLLQHFQNRRRTDLRTFTCLLYATSRDPRLLST